MSDMNDIFDDFESGNLEPEKYKEQLRKIYKSITGKDIDDIDDDMEFMNLDESDNYLQELSDEEQQEIFQDFINDNYMEVEINFIEDRFGIMVEEVWTSDNDMGDVKRLYYYDHKIISELETDIQKKVYESRLEYLIENEQYEEASEVRDILKTYR